MVVSFFPTLLFAQTSPISGTVSEKSEAGTLTPLVGATVYWPGTWISPIDVAKGIGSVVNGYERMTGAVNVELVKPEKFDFTWQ